MTIKILLDENLSHKLAPKLEGYFDEIVHVKDLGFQNSIDVDIWNHARLKGYSIITKDDDFIELAEAFGAPPKIIWFTKGNCSNSEAKEAIKQSATEIKSFITEPHSSIFIL